MGFGSKNYIEFDSVELKACAARYRRYSEELDSIRDALDNAMNGLINTYWVGTASVKFKRSIGDDWLDTTKRYCELLYDLTLIMDDVAATYDGLLEQAKQLRIH